MNRKKELLRIKKMATKNIDKLHDEYLDSLVRGISGILSEMDKNTKDTLKKNLLSISEGKIAYFRIAHSSILDLGYAIYPGTHDIDSEGYRVYDTSYGVKQLFITPRDSSKSTHINIRKYVFGDGSVAYVIVYDVILKKEDFDNSSNLSSGKSNTFYFCEDEKDVIGTTNYYTVDGEVKTDEELFDEGYSNIEQIDCNNKDFSSERKINILSERNPEKFKAYERCCKKKEKESKTTAPKKTTTPKTTPTLEIEPETKIPEDYIFPDFANDPEEESGIGRRKKPQVQPELDTDIDNMIEDVEKKRGFFPTNADVKGIMRGESFINFREQDTRGKEVISEMQKLMRDAGANIQPDGSFGKEMKEKLSNLLSKPISFLGKEQYLKLAEMAHEKGKTNWLIGYVAANEGVSPEEYYELMNNKETRKEMVSALKEEGLGRLRTFIKNRRSARAKGIPRSKRRRFFRR